MDSFCIKRTYQFTPEDMKGIFSELGTVREVKIYEDYSYDIHMLAWNKKGETFRNKLLEGKCRYRWNDDGHPAYFICEASCATYLNKIEANAMNR